MHHTPSTLTVTNQQVCQHAAGPDLKPVMEALKEIPPPALWFERKNKNYTPLLRELYSICVSSQLWIVCNSAVIYQSVGEILFVTFMLPTSKLNANEHMVGPFKVMGSTDLQFGLSIPQGVRQII